MFAIDADRLYLLFTPDDRDLALAFAEMEGYGIRRWDRIVGPPLPIDYFGGHATRERRTEIGAIPQQVRPGVYAYRVRRVSTSVPRAAEPA